MKNVKAKQAPILYMSGCISRLNPNDTIEPLLLDCYSTVSIGYVGLHNALVALFGKGLDSFDEDIYKQIIEIKGKDWTYEFADKVYDNVTKYKYFITNLGKCTQVDARPLKDEVYLQYLKLLYKEFEIINPKVIVLFGNQVSSLVLGTKISVSECRCKEFNKIINGKVYNFYSVYYPVGNGSFNAPKAIEDLKYILNNIKIL